MKDHMVALGRGFARLLPGKDPSGRAVMFIDPSVQDKTKYTRESMLCSVWYMVHAALESESCQQKGGIFIGYPRDAKFSQVDRTLMKMNMASIKGILPIRVSAILMCHPPTFFSVIFPFFQLFLGERLRKRIRVYSGSDASVLAKLDKLGLEKKTIPKEMGGDYVLDHNAWLEARAKEGK